MPLQPPRRAPCRRSTGPGKCVTWRTTTLQSAGGHRRPTSPQRAFVNPSMVHQKRIPKVSPGMMCALFPPRVWISVKLSRKVDVRLSFSFKA